MMSPSLVPVVFFLSMSLFTSYNTLVWCGFALTLERNFDFIAFVKVFDECDMKDMKAILEGALSDYRAQLGEQENLIRTF